MEQVAHQTIVMQFILELAKSLKVDPRGCFRQFFEKIKVNNYWDDTKSKEIAPCLTKKKSHQPCRTEKGIVPSYSLVCISLKSEE